MYIDRYSTHSLRKPMPSYCSVQKILLSFWPWDLTQILTSLVATMEKLWPPRWSLALAQNRMACQARIFQAVLWSYYTYRTGGPHAAKLVLQVLLQRFEMSGLPQVMTYRHCISVEKSSDFHDLCLNVYLIRRKHPFDVCNVLCLAGFVHLQGLYCWLRHC